MKSKTKIRAEELKALSKAWSSRGSGRGSHNDMGWSYFFKPLMKDYPDFTHSVAHIDGEMPEEIWDPYICCLCLVLLRNVLGNRVTINQFFNGNLKNWEINANNKIIRSSDSVIKTTIRVLNDQEKFPTKN